MYDLPVLLSERARLLERVCLLEEIRDIQCFFLLGEGTIVLKYPGALFRYFKEYVSCLKNVLWENNRFLKFNIQKHDLIRPSAR